MAAEHSLGRLLGLGFSVEDSEKALQLCGGDSGQAACLLRTKAHEESLLVTYTRDRYGRQVPSQPRALAVSMVAESRSLADSYAHPPLHGPRVSEVRKRRRARTVRGLEAKAHLQHSVNRAGNSSGFAEQAHHDSKMHRRAATLLAGPVHARHAPGSPGSMRGKSPGPGSSLCTRSATAELSEIDSWWALHSQSAGLWNLSDCHEAGEGDTSTPSGPGILNFTTEPGSPTRPGQVKPARQPGGMRGRLTASPDAFNDYQQKQLGQAFESFSEYLPAGHELLEQLSLATLGRPNTGPGSRVPQPRQRPLSADRFGEQYASSSDDEADDDWRGGSQVGSWPPGWCTHHSHYNGKHPDAGRVCRTLTVARQSGACRTSCTITAPGLRCCRQRSTPRRCPPRRLPKCSRRPLC